MNGQTDDGWPNQQTLLHNASHHLLLAADA